VKRAKGQKPKAKGHSGVVVLKLGGELLEQRADVERIAAGITQLAALGPVVVVHGGGKEIDAGLAAAGIQKVQVDGIRVTDAATLDVVVSVLAGAINTRLVAALRAAGARPVGLTGADAGVVSLRKAAPMTRATGEKVSLGLVGAPMGNGAPSLVTDLVSRGYVPVIACIGTTKDGQILNVNADTLAAHLAVGLQARRLVIAGGTAGVLDDDGHTIERVDDRRASRLIKQGTASAGMVAKLQACRAAVRGGVGDVVIVNGREADLPALRGTVKRPAPFAFTQVIAGKAGSNAR
jgi:acetylglutamate kinase